jgi:hypothetical protein
MLVTEDILAPHRSKDGFLGIDGRSATRMPYKFFTPTALEKFEILLVLAFTRDVPILQPGLEWLALDHQCGGYACEHQTMIATRLNPRSSVAPALKLIAQEGHNAAGGISIEAPPCLLRVSPLTLQH